MVGSLKSLKGKPTAITLLNGHSINLPSKPSVFIQNFVQWVVAKEETHSLAKYKEEVAVAGSATNGTSYHTPFPRLRGRLKQNCLLDMTGPHCTWAESSGGYMHSTCTKSINILASSVKGLMNPYSSLKSYGQLMASRGGRVSFL